LSILVVAYSVGATECSCKYHKARAEAAGTCSVSEDESLCTLTFTTSAGSSHQRLPSDVRSDVNELDPAKWSAKSFDYLPTLIGFSQSDAQQVETRKIFSQLSREKQRELRRAFASDDQEPFVTTVDGKIIAASYGCFAIKLTNSQTTLKTPFARSSSVCDSKGEFRFELPKEKDK
jgi:hypothetical protein